MTKEERNAYMREYNQRPKVKEKNLTKNKAYYQKNKEAKKAYDKKRRAEKKELLAKQMKEYYEANKEKINKYKNSYAKERRKTDFLYRLKHNIRALIKESVKRNNIKKSYKTEQILGITIEEFKKYLESKFESWMSWDNYGKYNATPNYGWDIDHIKPNHIATTESEVYELNHYTNLQPLCSYINRNVKGGKF